jgi:hypothetical protein
MILPMDPATEAHISSRWFIGLPVMLLSLAVLAENAPRLEISPSDDDDRLTNEIYNSASGWRSPTEDESQWRPERQKQESRIRFGYDSAYEEMRARGKNYSLDKGLGPVDHPPNTQFNISF